MKARSIICLLLTPAFLFSQERKFSGHGSQVQLEALGPGGLLSVNFESRFFKGVNGPGFKAGLGFAPYGLFERSCNTGGVITIPAGLNYLFGRKDHFFEMGAGGALMFGGGTKVYCIDIEDSFFETGETFYAYALLGYRYQPQVGKLSWRIFLSPLIQKGPIKKFWGGAGMGIRL